MMPIGRRAILRLLSAAVLAPVPALAAEEISDDALYDRVRRQLVNDRDLKILELEVEVKDGAVTVSGYVRTEKSRSRVDKVAKKVKGVKAVVNKVEVRP
jgi:osmotically-inducible protein OsmY